jgi:hypothetical protein
VKIDPAEGAGGLLGAKRECKNQSDCYIKEAAGKVNPHGSRYNRAGLLVSVVLRPGAGAVSESATNLELPDRWIFARFAVTYGLRSTSCDLAHFVRPMCMHSSEHGGRGSVLNHTRNHDGRPLALS